MMSKKPTKARIDGMTAARNASAKAVLSLFDKRAHGPVPSAQKIPCPYTYAKGKHCTGHIVRIEAFGADLEWALGKDGKWLFNAGRPRSHYHLYCSEKDNHAGQGRPDALKFFYSDLPAEIQTIIAGGAI